MVGQDVGSGDEGTAEDSTATGNEERKPKVARIPRSPTAQEWDDHMSHHAEYRDWCPWCVQGKGTSHHHKQDPEGVENWESQSVWIGHS